MGSDATLPSRSTGVPVCAIVVTITGGPDTGRTATADDVLTLGTAEGNDLLLSDRTVSRYHLELRRRGDRIELCDLGSTNGTSVGAATFTGAAAQVPAGTSLKLGATTLRVDDGDVHLAPVASKAGIAGLRGRSTAMARLMSTVETLAEKAASVLIVGESGTGKDLVARALHELGPRKHGPFVVVDCGALSPSLLQSELFGHERGAFTGAERSHAGAFERAHQGTLFLDEIGELPLEHQAALLGALERRRVRRLGSSEDVPVDVRLIAATHRDLRAAVNDGRFRLDLYYRLAVVLLRTPPLRERPEDVPILVEHFLREEGFDGPREEVFPPDALQRLMRHPWPGNARELRNVVTATLATGAPVPLDGATESSPTQEEQDYREARREVVEAFEKRYLSALLSRTKGNVREAARVAKMDRSHLSDLLKRHGIR
ncbi:MAG: sigma 54-interacting transcriptional regulator [Myxococcota bacterium]